MRPTVRRLARFFRHAWAAAMVKKASASKKNKATVVAAAAVVRKKPASSVKRVAAKAAMAGHDAVRPPWRQTIKTSVPAAAMQERSSGSSGGYPALTELSLEDEGSRGCRDVTPHAGVVVRGSAAAAAASPQVGSGARGYRYGGGGGGNGGYGRRSGYYGSWGYSRPGIDWGEDDWANDWPQEGDASPKYGPPRHGETPLQRSERERNNARRRVRIMQALWRELNKAMNKRYSHWDTGF